VFNNPLPFGIAQGAPTPCAFYFAQNSPLIDSVYSAIAMPIISPNENTAASTVCHTHGMKIGNHAFSFFV
jgi:hypothetical protein